MKIHRPLRIALQVLASLALLAFVLFKVDLATLGEVLAGADFRWLAVAVLARVAVTFTRIWRIGIALSRFGAVPIRPLISIGLVSGLVNLALPARAGDVLAIGLLNRKHGVPVGAAASAFLLTTGLIIAATAITLLGTVVVGISQWKLLMGAEAVGSMSYSAVLLLLGLLLVSLGVRAAGRRAGRQQGGTVRAMVRDTGRGLQGDRLFFGNALLATAQLWLAIGSLLALLPCLGIELTLPITGMIAYLLLTNALSALLPEGLGASSAASGLAIFTVLGGTESEAIAFASLAWGVRVMPMLLLGVGPLIVQQRPTEEN